LPVGGREGFLLDRGRVYFRPERDLNLYVAGCVASLGLVWLLLRALGRHLRRGFLHEDEERIVAGWAVLQLLLTVGVSLLFVLAVRDGGRSLAVGDSRLSRALGFLVLTGPGAIAFAWVALALAFGRSRPPVPSRLADWWLRLVRPGDDEPDRGDGPAPLPVAGSTAVAGAGRLFDLVAVAMIVAVVYSPAWDRITATAPDVHEKILPYFHWNAFAMGPAVGFRDGRALGTEVFSQYGVGWPMLFTYLDPVLRLSYTGMVGLSVIYGCLYFVGIYALLRLTLGVGPWALSGTILAIGMQLFRGLPDDGVIWIWPSSTFMRAPLDIWFFLCLLMHLRTARAIWVVLASALGGLAIAFEIDTGIYLTVILLLYATFRLAARAPAQAGRRRAAMVALTCALSFFATFLACLSFASRGTILRADFWKGFVEGLVEFSGGLYALPMATEPRRILFVYFYISVSLFLFLFARVLIPPGDEDRRKRDLFWGLWAAYGLEFLILFVYRSHSWNFYHASVPIVVAAVYVVVSAAGWAGRAIPRLGMRSRWPSSPVWAGYAALACSLVFLVRSPIFRNYPGLARSALARPKVDDRPGESGRADLASIHTDLPAEFVDVVAEMAALRSREGTVGVIHPSDSMFYLYSGCPFPFRYHSMMASAYTTDQLHRYLDDIARADVDYILIVQGDVYRGTEYDMGWRAFHAMLGRDYVFEKAIGSFELWRRAGRRVAYRPGVRRCPQLVPGVLFSCTDRPDFRPGAGIVAIEGYRVLRPDFGTWSNRTGPIIVKLAGVSS
jgi:hypothetical protein